MILDQRLDRTITKVLIEQNEKERSEHQPSGKLSASMLGQPLQWQVLKLLGVQPQPLDAYVLRKFIRGRHVEDWIVGEMDGVTDTQTPVEYKETVGLVDALVDTKDWEFPLGIIPHEVKSVSNAKYKRIERSGVADMSHRLQATLYAMALKVDHYAIDYVASDDYRIRTEIHKTEELAEEVDRRIAEVYEWVNKGIVPVFEPREPWQASLEYNRYPEWSKLDEGQLATKLKEELNDLSPVPS